MSITSKNPRPSRRSANRRAQDDPSSRLTEVEPICRPQSLTEIAVDAIREEILTGRFEMGAALSENQLAAAFGISRTPIRDALSRLEQEGLVQVVAQTGTFVFTVDQQEFRDICDFRTTLEMTALRSCCERDGAQLAGDLDGIVEAMVAARAVGDTTAYLRQDTEFHAALFRNCGNRYLADAYQLIAAKMATLRHKLGGDEAHMAKSFDEHKAILAAVQAGDVDEALAILEGHVSRKEGSYWFIGTGSVDR